ncbi:NUDIX domain-containing protein [Kitasatospora sp. NPDC057015]|uniref:NUDIX hydrolase n=1 Tax=Kitasatospora sp. NPDC057015 TaxID=3346001 RepID=UPI00362B5093
MAIPQFLVELRSFVGTRPLWLSGVAAVIVGDDGRVLLGQRADDRRWSLIGGILDPGEQPAEGLVREVFEEAAVVVVPEVLASVTVSPMLEYPNGDRSQYLELTFRCRVVSGEPRVNDDESLDIRWFEPDALPELEPRILNRLVQALECKGETAFVLDGSPQELVG